MTEPEFETATDAGLVTDASGLGGVLRGTATYTVVGMAQRVVGFVLLPLYARVLHPADYGVVAVLLTIGGAMQLLLSFGLETAVFRGFFLYHEVSERDRYLNTVGLFSTIAPILAVGPVFVAALVTNGFGLAPASYIGVELSASALMVAAATMPLSRVRAAQDFRAYMRIMASNTVILVLSKALFVLVLDWGVGGWVLSDFCGGVAMLTAAYAYSGHRWSRAFDRPMLRGALAIGLPLLPHLSSYWFLALSDRLVLGAIVSAREVGVYSMGYQMGLILGVVFAEINRAILPIYGRAIHSPTSREQIGPVASLQIGATALLGGLVASVGPTLLSLILPDSYDGAGAVVPAIALSYVFLGWYYVPMNIVSVMEGDTSFIFIPTAVAAVANIGLNLVFVERFGIQAAAIDTAVGYGALLVAITVLCRRRSAFRPKLDWGGIASVVVLSLGAALFCEFVLEGSSVSTMILEMVTYVPAGLALMTRGRRRVTGVLEAGSWR